MIELEIQFDYKHCEQPEDGKYIIQKMDTFQFEPVKSKDDEYYNSYSKAIVRFNNLADDMISKKSDYDYIFLARIQGNEYILLDTFKRGN